IFPIVGGYSGDIVTRYWLLVTCGFTLRIQVAQVTSNKEQVTIELFVMRNRKRTDILLHAILICICAFTLLPFAFVINNSLRTNSEMNHAFFGLPASMKSMIRFTWLKITGREDQIVMRDSVGATPASPSSAARSQEGDAGVAPTVRVTYSQTISRLWTDATR